MNSNTAQTDKYDFYRRIGSPKFIVAPMVDQSELPYRMLTRKYKADLCYTPMFHARMFVENEGYRKEFFSPHPDDRPLTVQFCANDPQILLAAAKYVENDCDAVDINFGCPQGIAKRGKYGSFLLEKTELIRSLVTILAQNLKVPVTCKIRCLPTEEETLKLAKMIEESGCSMLVVHGRTREHKKQDTGPANWTIIKKIKETLSIPVIANGGMATYEDCMKCLEFTGCDGVMSSESILEYPALYDNSTLYDLDTMALEYLDLVQKYPGEADFKNVRSHLHKFLYSGLQQHTDLRDKLIETKTHEQMYAVVAELRDRRKDVDPKDKIGWYYRYWKSQKLTRGETETFIHDDWNEQILKDPLFNKKLRDQAKSSKKMQETCKNDNILIEGGIDMNLGMFLNEENENE